MIEDYQIRIRTGAAEKTGERERTRKGTWRDKTRYVERYVTPAGTFPPEEWRKRAMAAIEAEGELALLVRVKEHCWEHCAWLQTESELEEYAMECLRDRAYRYWKDFEDTETIIWIRRKDMEYVQMTLNEWVEIKQKLRQELIGVKRSFVRIGYMLRRIDDQKGYEQDGYKSIAEFAQKELGLHPSTTTRFMEINREYSIDGYSERLREEYEDLSRSQLEEMLKLPEEDRAMIEPAASRESIRDLKRFNAARPEQSVTDCHRMDGEGQQADKLADLIESFFHDNREELNALFSLPEPAGLTEEYIREAAEIINPGGNRSYRKGVFFAMMYENKIMVKQFGSTPQELSWAEFLQRTWDIFGEAAAGAKTWDNYFGHAEPEEDKEETMETPGEPVTTECGAEGEGEHGKQEENETGAGVECGEAEVHDAGTEGNAHTEERGNLPDQGENTARPEASEKSEIAPAQKSAQEPVNTERGADFEGAENAEKPDMNPQEVVDAGKSRREYLDSLTDEGLSEEIVRKIKEMREARKLDEILKHSFWTAWLKETVDYLGRTMEEEAEQ